MKRRKYPPSLSLSLSLFYNVHSFSLFFLLPTLQYISLPYYLFETFLSLSVRFSFYLHEKEKISTLSLSLSLSLFYNVHSFSLFFLPSYPSIHSLPYYLMKPFYRSIFFSSQSDSLSIYMKRRKYPLSLSLSLSLLSLTSFPSLSSFPSYPSIHSLPYYLMKPFYRTIFLALIRFSFYLHEKEKIFHLSLSLSLSFHNVHSFLSSFSFLPFNTFPPYYLLKPFYRTIFLALNSLSIYMKRRKYPPSLSLSLSLSFITSIPSLSSFLLPTLQYISLPYYLMKPFYRSIFLALKNIHSLSLSLSLSLFYNVHSFSLFFLPSYPSIHSLPYYLMKPFYRKISTSLSLSLSLSFITSFSFSLFFLLPTLQYFSLLIILKPFYRSIFFSSQSDSLSIYMKRRKYPLFSLSLSLSLSLYNVLFLLSLLSPSYPSIHSLPYYLMKPFYRSIFFGSQSDSLSIYMKRRKYPSLSLSLSLSLS
ncbi:unnamed protein product [Acanthosepion pharaonis]|uniref:Uncharacterized protein n=1 Tax=Acanthosepion pharaonis TaxID=158019 RepID=A0A812DM82_ACAPH|nr:unnamed protein product [Sepia pharaonis]